MDECSLPKKPRRRRVRASNFLKVTVIANRSLSSPLQSLCEQGGAFSTVLFSFFYTVTARFLRAISVFEPCAAALHTLNPRTGQTQVWCIFREIAHASQLIRCCNGRFPHPYHQSGSMSAFVSSVSPLSAAIMQVNRQFSLLSDCTFARNLQVTRRQPFSPVTSNSHPVNTSISWDGLASFLFAVSNLSSGSHISTAPNVALNLKGRFFVNVHTSVQQLANIFLSAGSSLPDDPDKLDAEEQKQLSSPAATAKLSRSDKFILFNNCAAAGSRVNIVSPCNSFWSR